MKQKFCSGEWMPHSMKKMGDPKIIFLGLLLLVFAVIGGYLVRNSLSASAFMWMDIYNPLDYENATPSEILEFFKNLRIPIPPVIGLGEILSTEFFGSPVLITKFAYRISLVGVYCLAIIIAGTSCKRMTGAFLVSLLFLYATTIIHPGNPQNYDIFFPFFFLLYIFLIKRSSPASPDHKWLNVLLPFCAGFFLSMAELTRPFMIFLMPVLALSAYWSFRKGARKMQFLAFAIPVLLLSGGWNGYQFFSHQQITFSNHTGFNLSRAWPNVPQSDLVDEIHDTPLVDDRWENLNTPEHSANSKQRQKAVFRYWLGHPYESLITALKKVVHFLSGETAIYTYVPKSDWFWVYKLFVGATAALLLTNAGILFVQLFHFKRIPGILSNQDNVLLFFAAASIFLMAIGDMGEEARFLISVLPFLAALPVYRSWKVDTAVTRHTFW